MRLILLKEILQLNLPSNHWNWPPKPIPKIWIIKPLLRKQ